MRGKKIEKKSKKKKKVKEKKRFKVNKLFLYTTSNFFRMFKSFISKLNNFKIYKSFNNFDYIRLFFTFFIKIKLNIKKLLFLGFLFFPYHLSRTKYSLKHYFKLISFFGFQHQGYVWFQKI